MDNYVVVIGAANTDIGGTPYAPLIPADSNPGRISFSYGGVGRNIAHALSLLGIKVKLIAAVGNDFTGTELLRDCESRGIDVSHVLHVPDENSSVYMYINDEKGDMAIAMSYVDIVKRITPAYIDSVKDVINGADLVVADCNLSHETLMHIKKICRVPICVDTVSVSHASKIKGHLKGIDILKPNRLEAEYLTDMIISSEEDFLVAARKILSQGVGKVFISMSDNGILAADGDRCIKSSIYPAKIVSTTGAGDTATAAIIWTYVMAANGKLTSEGDVRILSLAARAANAAASLTIRSSESVSPELSQRSVLELIRNNENKTVII